MIRVTPAAREFIRLRRRLVRRRLSGLEPVLRLELGALALLLGGYLFLAARPYLEDAAARFGPWGVAIAAEVAWLACAIAAGVLVAMRHARRLRAPDGPAWMALPVEAKDVVAHLAWESKFQALWLALPALAVLVAMSGLVALPWQLLLTLTMAGFLWMGADVGAALAQGRAAASADARPGLSATERILTHVTPPRARPGLPDARYKQGPPWRALWTKDARLARRLPSLRQGLVAALVFAGVSLLGWLLPGDPRAATAEGATHGIDLRNLATFFVTLIAAATFAEWIVLLTGSDPPGILRPLPLGLGDVWTTRAAWAAGFTALLLAGHLALARGLAPDSLLLFLSWVAAATLGLAILGVHFGLSLYPQTDAARRLLGLTLGVMAITSTVVYLMGWLVLALAIAFTARRLPRWRRAEDL